jgi:hypothetical protein
LIGGAKIELLHPGDARSWKQVQFGEAQVQLPFSRESEAKREPHRLCRAKWGRRDLDRSAGVFCTALDCGRHAGLADFDPCFILQ